MANTLIYKLKHLTGASDALDEIDGNNLFGDELAFIHTIAKGFSVYQLNPASGQAESSPDIICPKYNAGNKRWELLSWGGN